ncbi:MAG TPA: hypothetical protein PLK44_10955 [Aestuariivirga sp.]|nr:hypothetical protein [Hyphomicrobiales bacterium]HQY74224.1 hypothetical protein [Aestuariivirga sp.]
MSENLDRVLAILAGAGDFLPATVIVAIILFFVKELLEVNRRRKANARKRLAIRRLVADEIERNNWTIKRLREGISELEQATEVPGSIFSIRTGVLGERYFRHEMTGELHHEFPIGKVHSEELSGSLLELAMIDEQIFDKALEASDATKELDHVLKSMIELVSSKGGSVYYEGFTDYARNEIADCEKTLTDFYRTITGRKLEEHRIR